MSVKKWLILIVMIVSLFLTQYAGAFPCNCEEDRILSIKIPFMHGDDIRNLQKALKDIGIYTGELTGDYDLMTKNAIEEFQNKFHIDVDGVVGEETWRVLGDIITSIKTASEKDHKPSLEETVAQRYVRWP